MRIDLHTHTTASDGLLTPTQLVRRAVRERISVLALTDHETLAGLPEATRAARGKALTIIPGIELAFSFGGIELHLLGLGVRRAHPTLRALLAKHTRSRVERLDRTVRTLRRAGFFITANDVERRAAGQIGRPHIAQTLLADPHNRAALKKRLGRSPLTVSNVIVALMSPGARTYVARWMPTPQQVINAVHRSGGLAILAHPQGLASISFHGVKDWHARLQQIARLGLDGLEVYAYGQTRTARQALRRFAKTHGLLVSGGSDYHSERIHRHQRIGYAAPGLPLEARTAMSFPRKPTAAELRPWLASLHFIHP
ncbi:MAG: PHP domain-containing protein [Candidatus Kerfeldbacteria bacterium]|nr:PHP domain-containing protein [Candidatus Kerfeldbacteria bacterium]